MSGSWLSSRSRNSTMSWNGSQQAMLGVRAFGRSQDRYRARRGNSHRGGHRQRRGFPQGPRLRCVARSRAARQYSTGGKAKLLGISKRGNVYLRKILIHGARAAVLRIKRDRAPIGAWLDRPGLLESAEERCCRCHGQQARTDRLGCTVQRQRL